LTLRDLNSAERSAAREQFARCCGSNAWADAMILRSPFKDLQDMICSSDDIWWSLQEADWLEAFSKHPKIGEKLSSGWSADEQRGMNLANRETATQIVRLNQAYEDKFGWIFIVCASGKTADEMRALLEQRMNNDRNTEMRIAAAEQAKITQLRLRKLIEQ
jgi:2-oxo-4-hydroxy-4-carboxy-5-ureidoimidazoline decarboxylase